LANVKTRGINLKTLSAYATLQQQETRLKDCGFVDGQGTIDINSAHDQWMGQDELHRIAKLEMLDEMEEWQLLAKHYCIVWGWTDVGIKAGSTNSAFQLWRNIKNTHA
jgi:[phosphatase 2A protein]-leucine-carboxy methyltransferase